MPMVLIEFEKSEGNRFDPDLLRRQLLQAFPHAVFDGEEQFTKRLAKLRELPESQRPPQFVIDDIGRTALACGPAYAFEMDADGVVVTGNVRSVDAVFLMSDMPPANHWDRIVNFAESIEGGEVTIEC